MGDRHFHGADVHARAAVGAGIGEPRIAVEVVAGLEHYAYGSHIGSVVAEARSPPEHGAGIHARSAADAFHHLIVLRAEAGGASVVDDYQVHLLSPARAGVV